MKKIVVIFMNLLVIGLISSCSNNSTESNEDYSTYSTEDFQVETQKISSEMSNMQTSEFVSIMSDQTVEKLKKLPFIPTDRKNLNFLSNLKNKITSPSKILTKLTTSLQKKDINTIVRELSDFEGLDFDLYCGTYTLITENDASSWKYSNSPTDKIIVKMPIADVDGSSKEAVFTWSEYKEQIININGEATITPVTIKAQITLENVKIASIDYSLIWNNETEMPESLSLNIFVKPFTLQLDFNISSNNMEINVSLLQSDKNILDIHAEIKINSNQTRAASGYISHGDFKYSLSIENLEQLSSIDQNDTDAYLVFLNKNLTGNIKYKNNTVATLKFKKINDEIAVYLEFNNGTILDLTDDIFSFEK